MLLLMYKIKNNICALNAQQLDTKSEKAPYSKLKQLFIAEFRDYSDEFETLVLNDEFTDMLMEYSICNRVLERTGEDHTLSQLYIQLKKELKQEIKNYIIIHIKNQSTI